MSVYKIIICYFLFQAGFSSVALDFSRINVSWQYDPKAEIQMQDRIIQNGDSMTVFVLFKFRKGADWDIDYLIQPNYLSETHKKLKSFTLDTIFSDSVSFVMKLSFEKPGENLLVVKISQEGAFYYYDIRLKNGSLAYPSVLLVDGEGLPIFDNFLNTSNFDWIGGEQFHATEYVEDAEPADPPMASMKALAPSILPDSTFEFSDSVSFTDNNFYVVRNDSNALSGVTIMKVSPYYPEFKLLKELATSMHYILNEPERKSLANSRDLRESFDSFWIQTFTSKFRARNAIRNYYNWIEQANKRFTDFKQGWKTDRGMIYIVYGVPDEVYRSDSEEEWFYDEGPSFEYTILSTFFTPETYALRRNIGHQQSWFEFVTAMRRRSE